MANSVVMKNLPVEVTWMPREKAEGTYGYRLYQGGVVPGRRIRVVKIGDWEVEACGGTHVKYTGEIGLIKIVRSERIQDGVERIIFSSGIPALKHVQSIETDLKKTSDTLDVPLANVVEAVEESVAMVKDSARKIRRLRDKLASYEVKDMLHRAKALKGLILVTHRATDEDSEYLIKAASLLTERDTSTVSLMFSTNETVKIVVMAGEEAVRRGVNAGGIASELAQIVGGGGSGRPDFGQGGGVKLDKVSEAISSAEKIVERQISEMRD
jgi:alanyl-tRNA synthetase